MQLTLDTSNNQYAFRSYENNKAVLTNGTIITDNFITTPTQLINPWQTSGWDSLTLTDFESLLKLNPEVILLGSGDTLRFPKQELLAAFYAQKMGIEVMNNSAACRTYNVLMAEGRRVAAALFLHN